MNFNNILKSILVFVLFILSLDVQSQAIEKGTGMTYTKGVPTHVPRIKYDAEINIDINNGNVYQWNRTLSQWRLLAEGIDIGYFNGAPTYIPGYGQSTFVINNQKKIYWYAGGWSCLNCSLGDVVAKNGLTEIVDSIILGGSFDRNTKITGLGLYSFSLDSLSSFYNLVWTSGSSAYNTISSLPTSSSGVNITSTSTSTPTINTNLNLRPSNPSQFISRTDSLNSYYRLTPDSIIVGNGAVSGYATTNKQFIITRDSFILKNVEYTPTRSIERLVIRPDGVVFKDSTSVFQNLYLNNDTLGLTDGNYIILDIPSFLVAGQGIQIVEDTIKNIGDLDPLNELQFVDSLWSSNDTLYISLSKDSTQAKSVFLPNDGDGIYGGDGTIPTGTDATLSTNGTFNFDYSNNLEAVIINDLQGATYIIDKTGFFGLNITGSVASLLGPAGSVAVGDTTIRITNLDINNAIDSLIGVRSDGTLYLVHRDSITGVDDGNGIYGGSGFTPPQTVATVDSILYFESTNDLGQIKIQTNSSLGLFGSSVTFKPDSVQMSYFDVAGQSRVTVDQDGILLQTPTSDRVTIQGQDARYQADYRATYNDRSLIDKKYGDDFYLQEVDTLRISNDTLYISLLRDSVPEKFVVLPAPGVSTDTSGYNLSFTTSNDTLFITDGNGTLFAKLPSSVNIYNSDGNIKDGGTFINVDGDDGLIFTLDNGGGQVNTFQRLIADYTSDDAVTNFFELVTPADSLYITSYDSGITFNYQGPANSGSNLTISSNEALNFNSSYHSITADTLDITNATVLLGFPTGTDGNGIYSSADTVAAIPDMLVRLRTDTTFAIGHTNRSGFEDFWDTYLPGDYFYGSFYSPNYWGSNGMQRIEVDSSLYHEIALDNNGIYINAEYGSGANRQRAGMIFRTLNNQSYISIYGIDNNSSYNYYLPKSSPSNTVGDTSIIAWAGTGAGASPIFIPKPTSGSGSDGNIYNNDGSILADTIRTVGLDSIATLQFTYPTGTYAIEIYGGEDSLATEGVVNINSPNQIANFTINDNVAGIANNANLIYLDIDSLRIQASGSNGNPGDVLRSTGSRVYWDAASNITDGNGIYSGSGYVPDSTFAQIATSNQDSTVFHLGYFPTGWADYNEIKGLYINSIDEITGIVYGDSIGKTYSQLGVGQDYSFWQALNDTTFIDISMSLPGESITFISPNLLLLDAPNVRVGLIPNEKHDSVVVYGPGGYLKYVHIDSLVTNTTDGNGIYTGDGTIPNGTNATLTNNGTFTVNYNNALEAININDAQGALYLSDSAGLYGVNVTTTASALNGPAGSVSVGATTIRITNLIEDNAFDSLVAINHNGTLRIIDIDTLLAPYLDNTDTSGFNRNFYVSNDTLYIVDDNSTLFVELPQGSTDTLDLKICYIEGQSDLTFELDALDGRVKDIDGNNVSFDIPSDSANLQVFKNGSLLSQTGDLTTRDYSVNVTTNTITFVDSVLSTDRVVILYGSGAITGMGGGSTDLSFSGSSSPVTLQSNTGSDVVFEAGSNITLNQFGDTLTINATIPSSQTVDTFSIVSDSLRISLSNDNVPYSAVDLAPYLDNTDTSGYNTSASVSNDTLRIVDGNGTVTAKFNGWDTNAADDVTGSGASGQVPYFTSANNIEGSAFFNYNTALKRLNIGGNTLPTSASSALVINGSRSIVNQTSAIHSSIIIADTITSSTNTQGVTLFDGGGRAGQNSQVNVNHTNVNIIPYFFGAPGVTVGGGASATRTRVMLIQGASNWTNALEVNANSASMGISVNAGSSGSGITAFGSGANQNLLTLRQENTANSSGDAALRLFNTRTPTANGNGIGMYFTAKGSTGTEYSSNFRVAATDYINSSYSDAFIFENYTNAIKSESFRIQNNSIAVNVGSAPSRTLHINGEARITDLQTDNPTRLVGADADGDLNRIILGSNLSLSNDTLNASAGSGNTDLSFSGASSPVTLASSTGNDVTITAGSNITLSATSGNITIAATGGGIDSTTARNTGATGEGVYAYEASNVLNFKKLIAGSNITLTGADSSITIAATGGSSPTVITPSTITSDQDNYSPTNWATATIVRISGDSMIRAITGFASAGIADGHEKKLINVGSFPVYIPGEHPDSQDSNRVSVGYDYIIYPKAACWLLYDNTLNRWVITSEQSKCVKCKVHYVAPASSSGAEYNDLSLLALNSGAAANFSPTNGLPSGLSISTSATSGSGYSLGFSKAVSAQNMTFGSNHVIHRALVSISDTSNSTDDYTIEIRIGLHSAADSANNSIGVRYNHKINSGNFIIFSRDNTGTESTTNTSIDVTANTLYDIIVCVDSGNTECRAYINGNFVGRVNSNMPNALARSCMVNISRTAAIGTATRSLRLHEMNSTVLIR